MKKFIKKINTVLEQSKNLNYGMSLRKGIITLISGLITTALMYLCSFIYCKSHIEVIFTSQSDREIEYQVYYATELGQRFDGLQSVKKKSSRGKHLERVVLPIKKIARFRLDLGVRPGQVRVSDMALRGNNIQSLNFDDFSFHNIDSKRIEKNELTIVSEQNNPAIIYQKSLAIVPKQSVDWCMFFLLLCFFGASSYLILSYLKLKNSGAFNQCSWIDIVFVSILGVLLCVPMMHVSEAERSPWENRKLAIKPHLFIRGGGGVLIVNTERNSMRGLTTASLAGMPCYHFIVG